MNLKIYHICRADGMSSERSVIVRQRGSVFPASWNAIVVASVGDEASA